MRIWHASYAIVMIALVSATLITRKSWATYPTTALYTVLLAGTLAALATGVYWLGLELSVYGWDMTAKQGKQLAGGRRVPTAARPRAAPAPCAAPGGEAKIGPWRPYRFFSSSQRAMSSLQPGVKPRSFSAITPRSETVAVCNFRAKMSNFFWRWRRRRISFFRSLHDTLALLGDEKSLPPLVGDNKAPAARDSWPARRPDGRQCPPPEPPFLP